MITAFIFARGGSQGLPGKNLMELGGKPLIAHSITTALNTPGIDRVVVSTDDADIAQTATDYGAEVPFMRPAELAANDTPEWLAWRHGIETLNSLTPDTPVGLFVSLPCTSPLRAVEDVSACLERYAKGDVDTVITIREAERSPYFNMVRLCDDGLAKLAVDPGQPFHRRQDVPEVYDITTVAYVCRPDFILSSNGLFQGRVGTVMVPKDRAIDIDTQFEFDIAECLIQRLLPEPETKP
ncbi:MAG: acylneuraminate cytidylyltransferase family protein [Arenibacter algicola]|nr:acylneuraminate cytidylyltransferase family protein [Arenibacter algicola]